MTLTFKYHRGLKDVVAADALSRKVLVMRTERHSTSTALMTEALVLIFDSSRFRQKRYGQEIGMTNIMSVEFAYYNSGLLSVSIKMRSFRDVVWSSSPGKSLRKSDSSEELRRQASSWRIFLLRKEPESILDRQDRVMRNKTIPFVKILWRNHPEREATWETEESIRTSYPHFLP
ncbi:DNA/RNA polymerases superfamily protein [Tanacetum coccineum]|uniref:DNA/RNA polymerases superfamily protein n=1 Tax=Tanacetum coccineum TaxID=301880 RepID=A0ABQ5J1R3_9ASTR